MSFLLDTDICSAYLRGNSAITTRFIQYGGRFHISAVSMAELTAWACRATAGPTRVQELQQLLAFLSVLDFDRIVALQWGRLRAAQLDSGTPSPRIDLMIAATPWFTT